MTNRVVVGHSRMDVYTQLIIGAQISILEGSKKL